MSQHEHEPTSCAPCLCLCIHSSTVGGCRPATWVLSRHRVLQEELKADIARADDYYRCSFLEHLERHSLCATHCLSCGFHTQSNPVECPHRNDHTASCVECNRAAGLFERMQLLIEKLLAMCTATADPTLEDDVLEWAANINVFEGNWRKLVAHLGQVSVSTSPAPVPLLCMCLRTVAVCCAPYCVLSAVVLLSAMLLPSRVLACWLPCPVYSALMSCVLCAVCCLPEAV